MIRCSGLERRDGWRVGWYGRSVTLGSVPAGVVRARVAFALCIFGVRSA